jgi:hypothetical protein
MTRISIVALLGALIVGLPVSLAAQQTLVWSDIDCAKSKLVIPAGLKCKETNTVGTRNASKSDGSGLTKRWSAYGTLQQAKIYYYVHDDFDPKSWVQVGPFASEIQTVSAQAKGATNITGPDKRGDTDVITFTNAQNDNCVGIRKYGPARGGGYSWLLYGTRCTPAATKASDAEINAFISGVSFRQ